MAENEWLRTVFNPAYESSSSSSSSSSFSASSSSSSTSSDEKAVDEKAAEAKDYPVRRALQTILKLNDEKDEKDGKVDHKEYLLCPFESKHLEANSYESARRVNVGRSLLGFLNRPLRNWLPPLTAPAPRGNFVLVGTDDLKAHAENFLLCMLCPSLSSGVLHKDYLSVYAQCPVPEPARYPNWIDGKNIVACTFSGALTLFSFDSDTKQLACTDILRGVHTSEIRELALCPSQRNLVASTGADRHLSVTDVATSTLLAQSALPHTGGSVKWSDSAIGGDAIGVTLDSGRVMFFDIRTSLAKPQMTFHLEHRHNLYTQARYGYYSTLLGYSNGDLRNVDLRTTRVVSQIMDHYVEGIGMIETQGTAFVTSGFCDFCVWNEDTASRQTNIWSHSLQGAEELNEDPKLTFVATWLDTDTIIATNNQGFIGTWTQGIGDAQPLAAVTNQLAATGISS